MDVIGWVNPGIIRIVKDGITMDVPDDMGNMERNEIWEWEQEGNTIPDPLKYAPPPPEEPEDEGENDGPAA